MTRIWWRRGWAFGLMLIVLLGLGCVNGNNKLVEEDVTSLWFYGKPLYEIYVRSFTPQGTFEGLRNSLDHIQTLGIKNIWLMPIHPIGELGRKGSAGSPYSVQDYFATGSEYGSKEDFRKLVDDVHARDMHLILDMVMNHSSNDHVEMEKHPDWYMRDEDGNFMREVADWSDVTDWDFSNPKTVKYLTGVLEYWVKEFDVDGYRCDVAGMVPKEFWEHAIPRLKKIKPDIFMLAEWEESWILDAGFNAAYDWTLYHRMKDHATGDIDVDSLWAVIEKTEAAYPEGKLPLRFVENHDEPRSAETFGWPTVQPYATLIFTLPGIPLMYNGQEVGAKNKPSLFEPEPIPWARHGGTDFMNFYHDLIHLRNSHEVLQKGDLDRIDCDVPGVLAFTRMYEGQTALVLINFTDREIDAVLPTEGLGLQLIRELGELGDVEGNFATLPLEAYSSQTLFQSSVNEE